jgi:GTPase Era involved in 16S rRNA processing
LIPNKDAVIVLGNTGSGKSTVLNYLMGLSLWSSEDKDDSKMIIYSKQKVPFEIGLDCTKSQTTDIKGVLINNIMYYDTPGLSDSRSFSQQLVNIS